MAGGHQATVDDLFDVLRRGQEIDVLRVATHDEHRSAVSLWHSLRGLATEGLPQLLDAIAPATLRASDLHQRVRALLAEYHAVHYSGLYFSDEAPGAQLADEVDRS